MFGSISLGFRYRRAAAQLNSRFVKLGLQRPPHIGRRYATNTFDSSSASAIPSARVDFRAIRDCVEYHQWNCGARSVQADPNTVSQLYQKRIQIDKDINQTRKERNTLAKSKDLSRDEKRTRGKELKATVGQLETERDRIAGDLLQAALRIPNTTHPAAPVGAEEAAVEVLRAGPLLAAAGPTGSPPDESNVWLQPADPRQSETQEEDRPQPRDHYELCELLDIADFGAGSRVSGPKFAVFKNAGAMLEMGIALWAAGELRNRLGMELLVPPDVAKEEVAAGCGFQPRGEESQTYRLEGTDQVLVATSEVTLTGMHAGAVHQAKSLPMVHAGVSHCFRREAGSSGVAQRGLYRLHQFSKAEMVVVCHASEEDGKGTGPNLSLLPEGGAMGAPVPLHERPEVTSEIARRQLAGVPQDDGRPAAPHSDPTTPQGTTSGGPRPADRYLQDLVSVQCWLLDRLGLSYRVLDMPTEELGASAHRKFDVEAWMPGRGTFGEVCSASDCGDYQARRLGIQYDVGGERGRVFAHTLNATAVAVPRVLLAILETHQRPDGSVVIPECLRPFVGGLEVLEPVAPGDRSGLLKVPS